jgi:hypothetical protein
MQRVKDEAARRYQLYPQVPEECRGSLPTDEDWQRLIESRLETVRERSDE